MIRPTLEEYYTWRMALAEYCWKMQKKGVPIDTEYVQRLEETFENKKLGLFPYTVVDTKTTTKNCPKCKGKGEIKPRVKRKTKKQLRAEQDGDLNLKLFDIPSDGENSPPRCAECKGEGKVTVTKSVKPYKAWQGPFNPNSPKAVLEWFAANGVTLVDKVGKPSIGKQITIKALDKRLKPYGLTFNPKTSELDSDLSEAPDLDLVTDTLLRLAQKQCAGKGLKSWFDASYIHNGRANPRFNPCGSSMSRLSSSQPNFQNIPRVGFGAEVRRAIVAEKGCKLVKADLSQLEFRCCLWHAGLDPNAADGAFEMLVEKSNGLFAAAAKRLSWKERDVAKSAIHGGDYMEGLKLLTNSELDDPRIIGDIKAKALLVYDGYHNPEWRFRGKFVCFTGGNLSERLFGDRTRENRRKALEIQEIYIGAFPQIRVMQRNVAVSIENRQEAIVYLPSGHFLRLYNRNDEDDLKQGVACIGQGTGAVYAQEGCLNMRAKGRIANLQVHDELAFCDIPESFTDEDCLNYMKPMVERSRLMVGFSCPAKVSVGPNWKDTREIGTIRWKQGL